MVGVHLLTNDKENKVITIDLHEFTVIDAKKRLQNFVTTAPKEVKEIIVIHGYNGGTALRDMVRKEFKHKRVERKCLSLNQGVTSLILKCNF